MARDLVPPPLIVGVILKVTVLSEKLRRDNKTHVLCFQTLLPRVV